MANELRVRSGFQQGTIDDNPLTNSATTLTSTELQYIPVIDTTNHMAVIFDPGSTDGAPEIAYITAHTASATTATIVRGQEQTTARAHQQDIVWHHGPTIRDFSDGQVAFDSRSSGDITVNGTSWANLDTGLDLVLNEVYVGDIVEVSMGGRWQSENITAFLDVGSLVSAAIVNVWGSGTTESGTFEGVQPWVGNNNVVVNIGGSVCKQIVSGDLDSGNLTLRFRARTSTSGNKVLNASTNQVLHVWAKNHGPQYTT